MAQSVPRLEAQLTRDAGESRVLSFVCSRGLHQNDPRNHTKSHEQSRFVLLRGSFCTASRPLRVRRL